MYDKYLVMDILTGLGIGATGAIIALIVEHTFLHIKEKRKEKDQRLIKFTNEERSIDKSIFRSLTPGVNIELMRSVLGTPNITFKDTNSVFYELNENESNDIIKHEDDNREGTNAYLYKFKNADVKITSIDNNSIDSLTVLAHDSTISLIDFMIPGELEDSEDRLWKIPVKEDLFEQCEKEFIKSRNDTCFVLSFDVAHPFYSTYTYFGHPDFDNDIDYDKDNPDNFIGGRITGICISRSRDDVYFIPYYELN